MIEKLLNISYVFGSEKLLELNKAYSYPTLNELFKDCTYQKISPNSKKLTTFNPSIFLKNDGSVICTATQTNRWWSKNRKSKLLFGEQFEAKITIMQLTSDMKVLSQSLQTIEDTRNTNKRELSDARLFEQNGKLWISTSLSYCNTCQGNCCMSLIELDQLKSRCINPKTLQSPFGNKVEKNWMPICNHDSDAIQFVYSISPTIIVDIIDTEVRIKSLTESPKALKNVRGGSQVVKLNDNAWIAIVHETYEYDRRYYAHRFVTFNWKDGKFAVNDYSEPFSLMQKREVEFAAGLIIKNNNVYVSFGYRDNEAWIVNISLLHLYEMLKN